MIKQGGKIKDKKLGRGRWAKKTEGGVNKRAKLLRKYFLFNCKIKTPKSVLDQKYLENLERIFQNLEFCIYS